MTETPRRKLTTIMSADVAGYSRLMDVDETGTLERLIAYRESIVGLVARHRGRVVNTAGDSLLMEFDSVVEAVLCAAEIQRELGARNAALDDDRQMRFRIGINLGDVMVEGDDLYGEGVNIAARLQGLAEPGGICISGTAYDQVHGKLSLGYDFIGAQAVKNIAEQVPVYRVLLDTVGKVRVDARPHRDHPEPQAGGTGAPNAGHRRHDPETRAARNVYLLFFLSLFLGFGALIAQALTGDLDSGRSGGKIKGDVFFVEDRTFAGKVGGDVVVAPGVTVRLGGEIEGDLVLGPQAIAEVGGRIKGDVINHGGILRLAGKLDGTERHEPPEAYDGPPAAQPASPPASAASDAPPDGEAPPAGIADDLLETLSAILAGLCALVLIAGVVLAYVHRGDGTSWLDSHQRFQIRTFWIGALGLALGAATAPILVGVAVLILLPFWLLIRCLRGWRFLTQGAPHPKPGSWLIG